MLSLVDFMSPDSVWTLCLGFENKGKTGNKRWMINAFLLVFPLFSTLRHKVQTKFKQSAHLIISLELVIYPTKQGPGHFEGEGGVIYGREYR